MVGTRDRLLHVRMPPATYSFPPTTPDMQNQRPDRTGAARRHWLTWGLYRYAPVGPRLLLLGLLVVFVLLLLSALLVLLVLSVVLA